jgi:hypothetical protein
MHAAVPHTPIDPIPELARWSQTLRQVAAQPLEFCPDFPAIAERFEAWWQQTADRPIFMAEVNASPVRPITRRLDLLQDPDAWYAAKYEDLQQTHRVGDTLPNIRADFGAVLLGGLYGGDREESADTSWTVHYIDDDWSNVPDWSAIREDNPWLYLMRNALLRAAQDAPGRYLVCTPDIGSSADTLITLRGSTKLCMDLFDHPEAVRVAVDGIYAGWRQAFCELYRNTVDHGAGMFHFYGLWSNRPYTLQACDFNALISPQHFREFFLPDIARQAATVGRAFFHLDGPRAAAHIDALLEVDGLHAIQFTPGAGAPSALAWVEMFRKIQAAGKSVLAICPPHEALDLCAALDPAALAVLIEGVETAAELDDLYAEFRRRFP